MKKLYAIIILSLFLVSLIPTTTAQIIKKPRLQTKRVGTETGEVGEEIGLPRIRILKAKKLENLTARSAFVKYKNLEFKARAINKVKIERARQNFLKAKTNFLKARERYQLAQQRFSQAKLRIRECKGNETDECGQIRERIKEHAIENLVAIADRILEHLNKLKAKVEANEDLSEEEAAEIIAKIEEQIQAIEGAKAIVETSESKEEIIEAAKTLKRAWTRIKARVKLNTARTINAKVGGIIVKSKQLEAKLNRIVERMADNDKDTSSIESLIEGFNTKLEEATTYYETALEKFEEAKARTPPNTDLIREGQAAMKDAHKALQEAQHILRDIILSIKQVGGQDELEAPEEEEIECETRADCDEDEVCQDGSCIRLSCETVDDCPEDMTCKDGECAEIECTVTEDCDEDEVCTNGLCVKAEVEEEGETEEEEAEEEAEGGESE